jgi:hypothetical protein
VFARLRAIPARVELAEQDMQPVQIRPQAQRGGEVLDRAVVLGARR